MITEYSIITDVTFHAFLGVQQIDHFVDILLFHFRQYTVLHVAIQIREILNHESILNKMREMYMNKFF